MVNAITGFIKKYLPYLMVSFMTMGFIKGHFYPMAFSKMICISALLVMVYPVMVNLRLEQGFDLRHHFKPVLVSFALNFFISPLLALGLGYLFLRGQPYMFVGLLLLSFVPTSGMTINWVHHTRADMKTAISLVAFNLLLLTLLLPFALPFFLKLLAGETGFAVDPWLIFEKIIFIIIIPVMLGFITRQFILRIRGEAGFKQLKPAFSVIGYFGLLLVMFLIMSLDSSQVILSNLSAFLLAVPVVVLYYLGMFALVWPLVRKIFKKKDAYPVLFSSILRYHIISLGIILSLVDAGLSRAVFALILIIVALIFQPPAAAFVADYITHKHKIDELYPD